MIKTNLGNYDGVVGVDFSLNSPGICVYKDGDYKFAGFVREKSSFLTKKMLKTIQELNENNIVKIDFSVKQITQKDYNEREQALLLNAHALTDQILNYIVSICENPVVIIEGFAFGSKGNRLIELASFQYILRYKLMTRGINFVIYSPKTIKKTAGYGAYTKDEMMEKFFEFFPENELKQKLSEIYKEYKISHPFEDMIDAFWGVQTYISKNS